MKGLSIYSVAVEALRERTVVAGKVTVEYSRVVDQIGLVFVRVVLEMENSC